MDVTACCRLVGLLIAVRTSPELAQQAAAERSSTQRAVGPTFEARHPDGNRRRPVGVEQYKRRRT